MLFGLMIMLPATGLALIMALDFFINLKKSIRNFLRSILWLSYGVGSFEVLIYTLNLEKIYTEFLFLHVPGAFLVGPATYFYFKYTYSRDQRPRAAHLLHLMPLAFVMFGTFNLYFADPAYKIKVSDESLYLLAYYRKLDFFIFSAEDWMYFFHIHSLVSGRVVVVLYFLIALKKGFFLKDSLPEKILNKNLTGLRILYLGLSAGLIITLFEQMVNLPFIVLLGSAVQSSFILFCFLNRNRFQVFHDIIFKDQASFTLIPYHPDEQMLRRLENLMMKEELFVDENLNREMLAGRLGISENELSKIINSKYRTNISRFINRYRIERAKELLAERGEKNILRIAFASGFNSKSTFNRVFKELEGISPGEYILKTASSNLNPQKQVPFCKMA